MPYLDCSLAGTPLRFAADEDAPLAIVQHAVSLLLAASPLRTETAFRCDTRIGEPAALPAGAQVHFEGVPPLADGPCIFAEHDGRRILIFPGRLSLAASIAERRAALVVRGRQDAPAAVFAVMHLLDWALEADGRDLLHGAALALPSADCGILVFAPSGAGKTTLALTLMHGGFRLYSDDLAVLGRSDGRAEIAGLPRSLKVHSRTAELLPWLAPLLGDAWDANGEQPLSLDQARAFAEIAAEPVPLAAILRLAGRTDGDHVLRPIPDMEALMHLCEEKLRGGQLGMPDFQRQTFRRLGAALAGVPAYELRVGRDLAGIPARVESAVAQAAAARSSGARR